MNSSMKSSFTSHSRNNSHAKDSHNKPLDGQFFTNLIKLETDIVQKTYTAATLDELMQSYGQAVEYYDSIKDQISTYFIFKIQDTLATKKSLKLLMQEQAKAVSLALNAVSIEIIESKEVKDSSMLDNIEHHSDNNNSQNLDQQPMSPSKSRVTFAPEMTTSHVIVETIGDDSSDEEEDDEEKSIVAMEKQRRWTDLQKKKIGAVKSLALLKNQKQKMFNLQMKLQSEKANDKQSLHEVLNAFGVSSKDNDRVVLGDIEAQRSKIRSKIAKKKKDGFMNFTQSSVPLRDIMENITIESVLKGLDDEDSNQSQDMQESMDVMQAELKRPQAVMCNE